jgi:hypothetical protein
MGPYIGITNNPRRPEAEHYSGEKPANKLLGAALGESSSSTLEDTQPVLKAALTELTASKNGPLLMRAVMQFPPDCPLLVHVLLETVLIVCTESCVKGDHQMQSRAIQSSLPRDRIRLPFLQCGWLRFVNATRKAASGAEPLVPFVKVLFMKRKGGWKD